MNSYDFNNGDMVHDLCYVDEDLDWENGDPYSAMHFKKKRSTAFSFLGWVVAVGLLFGYPICGLKMPQKDNPFYYRKKYGTETSLHQMQHKALQEYGDASLKLPETTVFLGPGGFQQVGRGVRMDLETYDDLIT